MTSQRHLSVVLLALVLYSGSTHAQTSGTINGRLSAGVEFTCALDNKNKAFCFGNNFDGELGTGNTDRYKSPELVVGNLLWSSISAGDWHTCGLTTGGDAYCWGYNNDGRCGIGSKKTPITEPTRVVGGYKWSSISAGYFYSCGVRKDGALFCWGKNNYGRLGNGQLEGNYTAPVRIGSDKDWVEVQAGGDHTCGRKTDRSLWCWGNNEDGQLGLDKTKKELPYSAVPLKLPGLYKYLSSNSKYSCAIKPDGALFCWGSNVQGQLGIGKKVNYTTKPTKVQGAGIWRQVSTGQFVTCGIKSDNKGYCWGAGLYSPTEIKEGERWISMAAGDWNGLGVTIAGSAYAWWENEWGEGGVGKTGYLKEPTEVIGGPIWGPPGSVTVTPPQPAPRLSPAPRPNSPTGRQPPKRPTAAPAPAPGPGRRRVRRRFWQ